MSDLPIPNIDLDNLPGKAINAANDAIFNKQDIAITNFIKKSIVMSRVYIQNKIADDPSLDDNLACIQNQYLSFILTALNLHRQVSSSRTVKTIISTVATEQYKSFDDMLDLEFGTEANVVNNNNNTTNNTSTKKQPTKPIHVSSEINKASQMLSIASGRIIKLSIATANGNIDVNVPVQLVPVILPNEVAREFVAINFEPKFMQRYIQWTTGEISFFKDLLFNFDLLNKRQAAVKKDKDNILFDHMKRQNDVHKQHTDPAGKFIRKLLQSIGIGSGYNKSNNIANSILIYDKQSFLKYATENGLNWKNPVQRDKFFNNSLAFMCVLIDPIYAKSEYYWSGINNVGEYSSKQLKAAKTKDTYDLKDIMAAFSQGNSPRF